MTIAELLSSSNLTRSARTARDAGPAAPPSRVTYVHAGQMFYSSEPTQLSTILGSCVAVCLWDSVTKVGGLNHYMLPSDMGSSESGPRFGTFAIPRLIDRVIELGADPSRIKAKIFGGASVLKELRGLGGDLGRRNVDIAREMLQARRIPVVFEDVLGTSGRKLQFRTDDGTAVVKTL